MRKLALISFLMVAALFWGCGQTDLSDDFKQNGQLRMGTKAFMSRAIKLPHLLSIRESAG